MSAVRIVMVLCGGLFLVLGPLMPPGDGDLWWQRWLGELILRTHHLPSALGSETFTATGAPWLPQEWFLSMLVALAMLHGWFGVLSVLVAAIPVGVLLSIYARSHDQAAPMDIAVALLLCGIALQGSFGVRAQVLGWGCFAAFLLFLQRRDGWYYAAIPAVVLWANVHASAMLAPILLTARIVGAVGDRGVSELRTSRDLRILPFVAIALLCTPFGWHLPAYSVAFAVSPIRQYIQEWQPATFSDLGFLFGAFPLALLIAAGGLRAALRNKTETIPIAMLFVAMLLAIRNVPLFAIAAAPLAAQSLDATFPALRRFADRVAGLERFAIVTTIIAFALSGIAFAWSRQRAAPRVLPTAVIARLALGGEPHRLFCENFSDCSIALQYSNLRVFIDGRCDPYPIDIWNAYISTIRLAPSWKSTLLGNHVNAIVASRGSHFAKALAADRLWRTGFESGGFVLYLRSNQSGVDRSAGLPNTYTT